MNITHRIIFPLLILFVVTAIAGISPKSNLLPRLDGYSSFEKNRYTLYNMNNISGWSYWDGYSGNNPYTGNWGVIYPRGTAGVVWAEGLVWGGYIHDGNYPVLRVGGQTYLVGTVPGRIISQGIAQNPTDPQVRIYRIRRDYLSVPFTDLIRDAAEFYNIEPAQVTLSHIDTIRASYERDWNEWPTDYGAPFYDHNNNGIYEPQQGEEPGLQNADQVIWFVCNDLDSVATLNLYGSPPIGLELQVTILGYDIGGPLGQSAIRRYRVINKSGFPVDSVFFSQWADTDLGTYTNDLVGCDSVLSIGFTYNGDPTDNEFDPFGIPPPSFGYVILQGPVIPLLGDSAIYNFAIKPDYQNLPMTSFFFWFAGNATYDHPDLGSYDGTMQWYNLMNGNISLPDTLNPFPMWHFTGPLVGRPTKFPVNGDPVTGIGDVDGIGSAPPSSSRSMVVTSGPFSMLPGDTQEVVIGLVGGLGSDHINSVAEMKRNATHIQSKYQNFDLKIPRTDFRLGHTSPQNTQIRCQADLRDYSNVNGGQFTFHAMEGSEPAFDLVLYDDGLHGDSLAGDQIWGNIMNINHRKYPHSVDLFVDRGAVQDTFPQLKSHLQLRPSPKLTNWQVIWENGLQDGKINNLEMVHLQCLINNQDAVNNISRVSIASNIDQTSAQIFIPPSAFKGDDSLYAILIGPSTGDSITFTILVGFDGHFFRDTFTQPVVPWSPPATWGDTLWVRSLRGTKENIFPVVADPSSLNGHQYDLTFFQEPVSGDLRWRLYDETSGEIKVEQGIPTNDPFFPHPVVDGILFIVKALEPDFKSFLVVANNAGPVDPPEMGCFAFNNNGFPFLYNARYPNGTDRPTPGVQQITNMSDWGVHTGGTTRSSYDDFVSRVTRDDRNWDRIIPYDYEMRFTAAGGYACWGYEDEMSYPVPFELWNIGINTPDDPTDDYRMIPWVLNDVGNPWQGDTLYNINPKDHAVSEGSDDPYMDWVYWRQPADTTPGSAGYENYVSRSLAGTYFPNWNDIEVMARTVFVNLDGGDVNDPAFPANLDSEIPEEGTVFRIITTKSNFPGDTLSVIASFTSLTRANSPYTFELWQNYPNPFNPTTTIRFSLGSGNKVRLEIFNILGQKVRTLIHDWMPAGRHSKIWDARNEGGQTLGSGIYFYRIKAGDFVQTRKMILLK